MKKDILAGFHSDLYCALKHEEIGIGIFFYILNWAFKQRVLDFSNNWQGHQQLVPIFSALNYFTLQLLKKTPVYFSKSPNLCYQACHHYLGSAHCEGPLFLIFQRWVIKAWLQEVIVFLSRKFLNQLDMHELHESWKIQLKVTAAL